MKNETKKEYQEFIDELLFGFQGNTENQRLARSAPELLEACKEALNSLEEAEESKSWYATVRMNQLREAIAKAEGKQWKTLDKKVDSMFTSEGRE